MASANEMENHLKTTEIEPDDEDVLNISNEVAFGRPYEGEASSPLSSDNNTVSYASVANKTDDEVTKTLKKLIAASDAEKPSAKKRISQKAFDEMVQDTQESLGLSLEEALNDAREFYEGQGTDLSLLVTTIEDKRIDDEFQAFMEQLHSFIKAGSDKDVDCSPDSGVEGVQEAAESLKKLVGGNSEEDSTSAIVDLLTRMDTRCKHGVTERNAAGRNDAVGALLYLCKSNMHSTRVLLPALRLLRQVLREMCNRDLIPKPGFSIILNCIRTHKSSHELYLTGLSVAYKAMVASEANKRGFNDVGIDAIAVEALHSDNRIIVMEACRLLKVYLSDDDYRPGVHAGIFIRARDLGENFNRGALKPLFDILKKKPLEDRFLVRAALAVVRVIVVNDSVCGVVVANEGVELTLGILQEHLQDVDITAQACALIRALSQNDTIKAQMSSTRWRGLFLLIDAVKLHMQFRVVVEQALQAFVVIFLRQSKNSLVFLQANGVELLEKSMSIHKDVPIIQRAAIMALRNMVSSLSALDSYAELDFVEILDSNIIALVEKAKAAFPLECGDVGYAAIRDITRNSPENSLT